MIRHHPDPDLLTQYAGGALGEGAMLVIACHVETCALCRQEVSLWESAGGALLEQAEESALSQGALARMMARLDAPQSPLPEAPDFLRRFEIPAALKARKIGRRRFVAPGLWFAPVAAGHGRARTYLVHAPADAVLAEHSHHGREFTQVLAGAFRDANGEFAAGDFALAGDDISHAPAVTQGEACLCVISSEAPLRLKGLPARLVQRLTGTLY